MCNQKKNLLIFAENCDVLEAMLRQLVTRFIACWSRKMCRKVVQRWFFLSEEWVPDSPDSSPLDKPWSWVAGLKRSQKLQKIDCVFIITVITKVGMRNILLQKKLQTSESFQRRNLLLCFIFTLCGHFVGNQCNYSALASWKILW